MTHWAAWCSSCSDLPMSCRNQPLGCWKIWKTWNWCHRCRCQKRLHELCSWTALNWSNGIWWAAICDALNFADYHFPHLRKLMHNVSVDKDTEFHIDTFFKNHAKLVVLHSYFYCITDQFCEVSLDFIKYLEDLESLQLSIKSAEFKATTSFPKLKKLKAFKFEHCYGWCMDMDAAVLQELASTDTLEVLQLGHMDVDNNVVAQIGRFKNCPNWGFMLMNVVISMWICPVWLSSATVHWLNWKFMVESCWSRAHWLMLFMPWKI